MMLLGFTPWSEISLSDAHIALVSDCLRDRRLVLMLLYEYFLVNYINLVRGYIEVVLIGCGRFLLIFLVLLVEGCLGRV